MHEDRQPSPARIEVASEERQADALRLVFEHLDEDARTALVTTLLANSAAGALPMAGLFDARRSEELVGAVWAQIQPGRTGVLWPPRVKPNEDPRTALELMTAADAFFARHAVSLAQTLLEDARGADAALLKQGGYEHFAELLYLVCTEAYFPPTRPDGELEFEAYTPAARARLAAVMEATYEATLDCPRLNGARAMEDVLTGYQATGRFDPGHWRIVRSDGRDVGCLLLADHPVGDQWELVYMGLVPAARGRGLGLQIIRFAQYLTGQAGRGRLVLAVDADNAPALALYASAGFLRWDQRSAFLRIFESERQG
jgi:RimJ/RimL family protein N-acetyltransferase